MKTTIDIPEPLYRRAKIRAIETGQTFKQLVLAALEATLEPAAQGALPQHRSWPDRRTLLPGYEAAMKAGALRPKPGDRDVTELISEDRDGVG